MENFKKVYILGIGGTGMSSIAKYISQSGIEVKGYDQRKSYVTNALQQEGIVIDFNLEDINYHNDTLYVFSTAFDVSKTNLGPHIQNDNIISRPKYLENLSKNKYIIGVTGTHGKTSTTAILSHIFHYNNKDVSYIYGGSTSFNGIGGHYGKNDEVLILEADEAFNTFENILIQDLVVTNIDEDHLDYYQTYEKLVDAFKNVINNSKRSIVLNFDNTELKKMNLAKDVYNYSSSDSSDIVIKDSKKIIYENTEYNIETHMIGNHFISNIVGAVYLALLNGISIQDSLNAIKHFPGVKRRAEYLGSVNGVNVYDDYGHHPTEIDSTIEALKNHVTGKLFVVFQPHRYTRTKLHQQKFKESLQKAQESIVVDIYPSGEKPIPGVTSKNLEGDNIKYLKSMRAVPNYLSSRVKEGDTILTIGAGDITLLGPQILKYLDDIK